MVEGNTSVGEVFSYITLVLMIMSIVGAFLTIVNFIVHYKIRTYPIKLILYLCICIEIGFTSFLMAFDEWEYEHSGVCIVVAIFVHYYFLANFCWTFCIAFNFYQMIVRRNREAKKLEKFYHIGSWCLPAIFCAFTGGFDEYGNLGSVCYIKSALVRFLCFFIPGLVVLSSNAVLFFFIAREIHDTLAGAPKSDQRDRKKEFRVYLSIFISIGLSWIFGYIMFLLPFPVVTDIFFVLFSVFTPMQGILIFIFYCLNKKVLARWAGLFGICLPCCKTFEQRLTTSTGTGSSRSSNRSRNSGRASSRGSSSGGSGSGSMSSDV